MRTLLLLMACLVGCDFQSPVKQPDEPMQNSFPSLVFSDFRDGCWHILQLHTGTSPLDITHPEVTCYEGENDNDVSPNHKASLLHTLGRGVLEDGANMTSVEAYACRFIDLESGKISYSHTYDICGGHWDQASNWVVSDNEYYSIAELF